MLVGSASLLAALVVPVVVVGAQTDPQGDRRQVASTSTLIAAGEELVSERTKTSQTFRVERGAFVTRVYGSPVNTGKAGGGLARVPSKLSAIDGVLEFRGDGVDARLPERLSASAVKVSSTTGTIGYRLADAGGGEAAVTDASARYADVRPDTDVTVTALADGVKEDLQLNSADAPSRFAFDLTLPAKASARLTANGSVAISTAGDEDFEIAAPFMVDDARSFAPKRAATYSLTETTGGYRLMLTLDRAWLTAEDRAFPVTVDPTIRRTGTTQTTDVSLIESVPDIGYGGSQGIFVGRYAAYPTTDSRGGLKFDLAGVVPTDARVLQAKVGLKSYYKENSTAKKVGLHPLTRGFTHDATWNRYNATNAWTTAGGEFDATPSTTTSIGTSLGWHYWYPTELAQEWVNGSRANNGFVLKDVAGEPKNGTEFRSSEYGTAADRPYLDIVWYPRTGDPGAYTFDDHPLQDGTVLRVNVFDGNLFFERADVTGTGPGQDFTMRRYFNSKAQGAEYIHSGFGPATWTSSSGKFVGGTVMSNGDFIHQGPGGFLLSFLKQADGSFRSPPEYDATLVQTVGAPWGQTYTMTLGDGTIRTFGADGTWTSQRDAQNNTLTPNYPVPSYLHTSITGTNGLNTTFQYVDGTQGQKLTSRTTNPAGQYDTYTHTNDRLTSEARNGTTRMTYGYDVNGRLNRITDSTGRVTQITIDASDRVTQIIDGPNANDPKTTYAYVAASAPCESGAVRKTAVTNPDGTVNVYCTDSVGGVVNIQSTAAESPVVESIAAEGYADDFNVTQYTARAVLRLQGRAAPLGQAVADSASGSGYAGTWFDDASRRVKVGLKTGTSATGAQQAINSVGIASEADIVFVPHTQAELEAGRDTMRAALSDLVSGGLVALGFNTASNAASVKVATGLSQTNLNRVASARAGAGVATTLVTEPGPSLDGEAWACNREACDPPARGGVGMEPPLGAESTGCTTGFVAKSRSDQKPYIITAGHCVEGGGSGEWLIPRPNSPDELLGFPANSIYDSRGDFGLVGINTNSPFFGSLRPYVYVERSSQRTGAGKLVRTSSDPTYTIRLALRSPLRKVTCFTGLTSGTRCGRVVDTGEERTIDGRKVGNLGVWRALSCGPGKKYPNGGADGDSGAPFFRERTAYGILSGGKGCTIYFSGAKEAENNLNVNILTPAP